MEQTRSLGISLHHLSAVLDRQSDILLNERFGLGFSQFKILMGVSKHNNLQQREIAEALGQTEASVSRQIRLLVDEGLIASTLDPENRRQHQTRLTPKGERILSEAMSALESHYQPMFASISEHRLKQLQETLDDMHQHICGSQPGGIQHLKK